MATLDYTCSSCEAWVPPPPPQVNPQLPNMEFGRRLSVEKELEKMAAFAFANAREFHDAHRERLLLS